MAISSDDPVLAGETTLLTLEIEWSSDLAKLCSPGAEEATNAGSAFRSLGQRLAGTAPSDVQAAATLVVYTLSPEELAVALAAEVGRAREDKLFRVCSLVELLRRAPAPLDDTVVRALADRQGVAREVAEGLAVAAAIDDRAPAVSGDFAPPRVLEWARYGPESVNRYPWLRAAYYLALSLLTVRGVRPKLAYFGRATLGGRRERAILPSILVAAARGTVRAMSRPKATHRDFAYWIDPPTASRLVSVRSEHTGESQT
jgi:hypothetical protein